MNAHENPSEEDVCEVFTRWVRRLDDLEGLLAAPRPQPLVPGTELNSSVGSEWRKEMSRRDLLLKPLALEMAAAYVDDFDQDDRRRTIGLLAAHPRVEWQWPGCISRTFTDYLSNRDPAELSTALALTAIYDYRSQSRDFHRLIYPIRVQLTKAGIDAAAVFEEATELTVRNPDPGYGAYGLFMSLGRRWDMPSDDEVSPIERS